MNHFPGSTSPAFLKFMSQSIGDISEYGIQLKYTEKGESKEIIERQIEAFRKMQLLPPNKKTIANAQLEQGSSPLVAYAIGKFSTHIAEGFLA